MSNKREVNFEKCSTVCTKKAALFNRSAQLVKRFKERIKTDNVQSTPKRSLTDWAG